jgi:serine/threonine-protein kinase HipA
MDHLDFKQRGTHTYAQLFMVVSRLNLGDGALEQVFRRMAFNVMARNCDDHTKNFAFLLRQGGNWELAPAYDVTHAYNPRGEWTYRHLMSVSGKFKEIAREHLLMEAERFGVSRPGRSVKACPDRSRELVEIFQRGWVERLCIPARGC